MRDLIRHGVCNKPERLVVHFGTESYYGPITDCGLDSNLHTLSGLSVNPYIRLLTREGNLKKPDSTGDR